MDERVIYHFNRLLRVQNRKLKAERYNAYFNAQRADLCAPYINGNSKQTSMPNKNSETDRDIHGRQAEQNKDACEAEEARKQGDEERKEETHVRQEGE